MQFAEDGICMGCKTYEAKSRISDEDYQERKEKLMEIIDSTLKDRDNNESNYDCIVSVSGEKILTIKHTM